MEHIASVWHLFNNGVSISCADVTIIHVWAAIIRLRAIRTPRILGAIGVCVAHLPHTYCVRYSRQLHDNFLSMFISRNISGILPDLHSFTNDNTLTICISLSCNIDITWCKKFVGVHLSYFKRNFNNSFCMTCNLDVSLAQFPYISMPYCIREYTIAK